MAVNYQSFQLQQGQNVELQITITDTNGDAVDLTGASIRFAMARSPSSAAVVDNTASPQTATHVITDATGGLLSIYIDDVIMDDLLGDYYYEVKVTDVSLNEAIVTRGYMTVLAALT